MKKLFLSFILFAPSLLFSQNDVTTFLGIPVDGFRPEMEKKLIEKGFSKTTVEGKTIFEGEFNGEDVNVHIGTNNNKVYRIMLCDKKLRNEADIKIRFNRLVRQFENNNRYLNLDIEQIIGDDVDISYEMIVKDKVFEAAFYQNVDFEKIDTISVQKRVEEKILSKYSKEYYENNQEEVEKEALVLAAMEAAELAQKKCVWFRIVSYGSEYYIAMYYDNEYNKANGDDL